MAEQKTDTHGRTPEQLLTTEEVAKIFRVEPRTINEWVRRGRLHNVNLSRGRHLFRPRDITAITGEPT